MRTPPTPEPPPQVTEDDVRRARSAIALMERTESQITSVLLTLGTGGLVFTAVNVTLFAIEHDVHWAIAWLLDPLVSLSLLAVLYFDGRLAAYGFRPRGWPFVLRWFTGLSTWLMNSWQSLYPDGVFTGIPARPDAAGLVLHSVIPFLVIILAEAGARYRHFTTGRKEVHQAVITAWRARQQAAEAERAAAAAAEEERAAALAAETAAAAEKLRVVEADAAAKLRVIEAEAAAKLRVVEEQRRAAADAEERRISAAAAEEQRRISAAARQAQEAAAARDHEARLAGEAREREARIERDRIAAEAKAAADLVLAQDRARAAEMAREERARTAEMRRARAAETVPAPAETSGRHPQESAGAPAEMAAGHPQESADGPAETDPQGWEAKRQQIEHARFEAAVLMLLGVTPTRSKFAEPYGRSAAWARERFAEAEAAMEHDAAFADRVLMEADQRQRALAGVR